MLCRCRLSACIVLTSCAAGLSAVVPPVGGNGDGSIVDPSISSSVDAIPNVAGSRCLLQSKLSEGDMVAHSEDPSLGSGPALPGPIIDVEQLKRDLADCERENAAFKEQDSHLESVILDAEKDNKDAGAEVAHLKYKIRVAENETARACKLSKKDMQKLDRKKKKVWACKEGHFDDEKKLGMLQKQLDTYNQEAATANAQIKGLETQLEDAKKGVETEQAKLEAANTKYMEAKNHLEEIQSHETKWKERVMKMLGQLDATSNPAWESMLKELSLSMKSAK